MYINSFIKGIMAKFKVSWLLNLVAALIFLWLAYNAISKFDSSWDNLAYHYPFAARQARIMAVEEVKLSPFLEDLYKGVPQLVELLQGFMWRVTGYITAMNFVSLGSLFTFIIISTLRLKLKFWQLTLLSLSVPLILIHSISSYNDLPNGSFIACGIVGLFAAIKDDRYNLKYYFGAIFPLMLAANVKFQALPVVVFYTIIIIIVFLWQNWKDLFLDKKPTALFYKFFLVTVLLGGIGGYNMIKNYFSFQNPVYPLSMSIGPIHFETAYSGFEMDVPMSQAVSEMPRFVIYLLSLSELYLWTDNPGSLWGIGGMAGNLQEYAFFKLGGFFVANLVLWSMFILAILLNKRDKKMVFYSIILFISFLFVGFLPSSGLLRYWLFLPLVYILVVLLFYENIETDQMSLKFLFNFLQIAIFAFVVYQAYYIFVPGKDLNQRVTHEVSYARLQASYHLDGKRPVCIVHKRDNRLAFLYKLANMSLNFQDARTVDACIYDKILILDNP